MADETTRSTHLPEPTEGPLIDCVLHQSQATDSCGFSGFGFVIEVPQECHPAAGMDLCAPLSLFPGNATVLGRRPSLACPVLPIAGFGDFPKVDPTIVEAIPVDVIAFESVARLEAKQFSVQVGRARVAVDDRFSASIPLAKLPSPLTSPLCIISVYDDRLAATSHRDASGSIPHEDGGTRVPPGRVRARRGTVPSLSAIDLMCLGKKLVAAVQAAPLDGTMVGHREVASPGVCPGRVTDGSGHRCDYTSSFRVEVA